MSETSGTETTTAGDFGLKTGGSQGATLTTPVGDAPIQALGAIALGAYLMWFGIKYWRGTGAAVWPSYPIKSVLQGKGLPPNTPAPPPGQQVTSYEKGITQQEQQSSGTTPPPGGPPPKGNAQNIARVLLSRYGWGPTELPPLILLWNRESGWQACAYNPSGAYGIAQALGHGSATCATGPRCDGASTPGVNCAYGGYGQSPSDSQKANAGAVLQQIEWGLNYIRSTYGTPTAAWAHEQQFGWY